MIDEFSGLSGTDGDEALVATVLAILLVEHDAGDAASLALFGRNDPPRSGARYGKDRLGVFGVRPRKTFKVREWWEIKRFLVDGGSGSGSGSL